MKEVLGGNLQMKKCTLVVPIAAVALLSFLLTSCGSSNSYDLHYFHVLTPQAVETFPESAKIVEIAAATDRTLGLDEYGNVWAWGSNQFGGLGAGENFDDQYTPINISQLTYSPLNNVIIKQISVGNHSLALDIDGDVWAWGDNWHGQLGTGESGEDADEFFPVNISESFSSLEIVQISAEWTSSLALDENGHVWAWGNGEDGRLGTGDIFSQEIPINISAILDSPLADVRIAQISAGMSYSLALDEDGKIWAWGSNSFGQLGTGNLCLQVLPINISTIPDSPLADVRIAQISAGAVHSLALDENGEVWAWGSGSSHQLGTGTTRSQYSPTNISDIADSEFNRIKIVRVEAGRESSAIDSKGNAWAWGDNWHKELGVQDHRRQSSKRLPLNISNIEDFTFYRRPIVQISSRGIVLLDDGSIYAWGDGYRGRLGIGDISEWAIPFED